VRRLISGLALRSHFVDGEMTHRADNINIAGGTKR
jgi:hypothetical protein